MMRILTICGALAALMILGSPKTLAYEEPEYSVVAEVDGVEYRRYEPYLIAETLVSGDRDRNGAANAGFRRLFGYISGENVVRTEVSSADLAAGVGPELGSDSRDSPEGTKISMTVPVLQEQGPQGWSVAFVVPSSFDESSAPKPANAQVNVRTVPARLMAVLTYSGRWTDENVDRHGKQLFRRLAAAGVRAEGDLVTAYYNAPFTLPFMRRNEVMVPVSDVPGSEVARLAP
jgi:hypothetical protein